MRIGHFESLRPVCPRCKIESGEDTRLAIAKVARQQGEFIIEALLRCTNPLCRQEYPVIDGIPIIVSRVHQYLNDNIYHLTCRTRLSALTQAVLGDAAGPGAVFNTTRHYLSTYAWDHYGDKAPAGEFGSSPQNGSPGSIVKCLFAGLNLLEPVAAGPILDVGCAVGRTAFELARQYRKLVLGVDLNFSLLRMAQQVLQRGRIHFPLKHSGMIYTDHQYEHAFENREYVDFWACDALAMPFHHDSFSLITALNVFDTVSAPRGLITAITNLLHGAGQAVLSTPYDWSAPVQVNQWEGGHGFRDPETEPEDSALRGLLATTAMPPAGCNLQLIGEIDRYPWQVRIHNRRTARYDAHIVACRKTQSR